MSAASSYDSILPSHTIGHNTVFCTLFTANATSEANQCSPIGSEWAQIETEQIGMYLNCLTDNQQVIPDALKLPASEGLQYTMLGHGITFFHHPLRQVLASITPSLQKM
jgi:hypothetical protein